MAPTDSGVANSTVSAPLLGTDPSGIGPDGAVRFCEQHLPNAWSNGV